MNKLHISRVNCNLTPIFTYAAPSSTGQLKQSNFDGVPHEPLEPIEVDLASHYFPHGKAMLRQHLIGRKGSQGRLQ